MTSAFSIVFDELVTEDIEGLVDQFPGDSEQIALLLFSPEDMEAIMSGETHMNIPNEKRRCPRYIKVKPI